MKQFSIYLFGILVFIAIGWFANTAYNLPKSPSNPISQIKPTPLTKYSFENLAKAEIKTSEIQIGKTIKDYDNFTAYEFSMEFSPDLGKNLKKVTGLINIPKGTGTRPLIVMFRGYVDQELYEIGMGTQRAGEYFAKNGFITIAPDFLGYGNSDIESSDIFESRFQAYTTALSLLKTIDALKARPLKQGETVIKVDINNVFLWGHSNGGHLALAILEITGKPIPTVLWAPNSAKFPYSIIYYLDEAIDEGKLVITKLAEFMGDYDVRNYSIRNYFERINPETKIQIHQGLADEAVPVIWTDSLVKALKKLKIDTTYLKYPGANHNLTPSWDSAATSSLNFYNSNLTK